MSAEAPEVIFDAPVPASKKKRGKKGKAAAVIREPKSAAPFPGLTRTACANACNAAACAISGKPYCAHPTKGGLQSVDLGNPEALKRQNAARGQLDVRLDPDRFK